MVDFKMWYQSRTIWASIVSIIAAVATYFGLPLDEATRNGLTDGILQLVSAGAGVVAIFGRLSASSKIAARS